MPSAPPREQPVRRPGRRGRAGERRSSSADPPQRTCQAAGGSYLNANRGKRTSASGVTAAPPPRRRLDPASCGPRVRGQRLLPRRLWAGASQPGPCCSVTRPPPAEEAGPPGCGSGRGAVVVPGLVRRDVARAPALETLGRVRAVRCAAAVAPPVCGRRASRGPVLFFTDPHRGSDAKVTGLACTSP